VAVGVDRGGEAAVAEADLYPLAGSDVGGGGDEAAVGVLGQAEAALEHSRRRQCPQLAAGGRDGVAASDKRRADRRLQPVARGGQRGALLEDAALRVRAVEAHLARGELNACSAEASRENPPPALQRFIEPLPPLVEQPARIAETPAQSLEPVARGAHRPCGGPAP